MLVRLQKYLAQCSVASRRKCEELIINGEIKVNGEIVTELGTKVDDENDKVEYNDCVVTPEKELRYIMLHKPEGYVTSVSDQFERLTVMDLIENSRGLYPIGRLDYDTSGLLIMTNDGDLTYKLTHPKHNIDKVYVVKIFGIPTEEELEQFRTGVIIDGKITGPSEIEILKSDDRFSSVKISIREGRNRQVRKMCDAINHDVASLKRVATGKLFLGKLPKGEYRNLTKNEVNYLKEILK